MKTPYLAATLLVAQFFLHPANAADADREIEEITVTPLGQSLQPTNVIDDEQLFIGRQPSIGETLANELGVSSSYFGPAASRPIIRGLSGPRVSVLTDRISSLDVSDVSPDHAVTIEPLLAERVEIVRGPKTLLYGSAANGGVVNVIDSRIAETLPERLIGGAVEVRGDTAMQERAVVGRLDGGFFNQFAWHVDGFRRETEDIDIDGYATADPAERPDDEPKGRLRNSDGKSDGVAGGLSWVGSRGFLGVAVSDLDNKYGLPGPEEDEGGGGPPEPFLTGGPRLEIDQTRWDVRGEYRFDAGWLESARLSFGTNDYEHEEIEPSGEVATTFDNDAWEGRLEAVHSEVAGFRGVLGLQVDDRDFEAVGEEAFVDATDTDAYGLFLAETRETDWGRIEFGLRYEPLEHDNDQFETYDENAVSVAGGLAVGLNPDVELTFNLSRTERHPAVEELYANGAHIATRQVEIGLLANPNGGSADTENTWNVEVGLAGDGDVLNWSIAAFYSDIEDYVYQEPTGNIVDDLPEVFYRQDDADFYGLEGELEFPLGFFASLDTRLRVFGDYVRAKLDDSGPNGDDLPFIPPLRVGTGLSTGTGNWRAGIDVIYHAEQDDVSSFETDDFTMVNVGAAYRLDLAGVDWEVFARGTNLLDEDARRSTSVLAPFAPLPGASLSGGIRGRF